MTVVAVAVVVAAVVAALQSAGFCVCNMKQTFNGAFRLDIHIIHKQIAQPEDRVRAWRWVVSCITGPHRTGVRSSVVQLFGLAHETHTHTHTHTHLHTHTHTSIFMAGSVSVQICVRSAMTRTQRAM